MIAANDKRPVKAVTRRDIKTEDVIAVLGELEDEDRGMQTHLLDAAVAGATLARDPADRELRAEATRAWKALGATMSHHLTSEDELVLPWAEANPAFPQKLVERARERAEKLRRLAQTVAGVSFARDSNEHVKVAARALCALAVHLDDLIDGEERNLFPMLQRSLFARAAKHSQN